MTRMLKFKGLALLLGIIWLATLGILTVVRANEDNGTPVLRGRIVAVNIPGASAISAVGTFLPGGPIHDKPAFAAFTQPGKILDPTLASARVLSSPSMRAGRTCSLFPMISPRQTARCPFWAGACNCIRRRAPHF